MVDIIPAVLPTSFEEIQKKSALVAGHVPFIQLDVCDGHFVPSRSWPYTSTEPHRDHFFKKILHQSEGLPSWKELNYEIDIMVAEPTPELLDDWIAAGASRLVVHLESVSARGFEALVSHLVNRLDATPFLEFGVALALETPLDAVTAYLEDIDVVQFMGIERVGYQGQEFAGERVLDRVRSFHGAHPEMPISVDGGVTVKNAQALVEAGASRLIIGSAIFGSPLEDDTEYVLTKATVSSALKKFKEIL